MLSLGLPCERNSPPNGLKGWFVWSARSGGGGEFIGDPTSLALDKTFVHNIVLENVAVSPEVLQQHDRKLESSTSLVDGKLIYPGWHNLAMVSNCQAQIPLQYPLGLSSMYDFLSLGHKVI